MIFIRLKKITIAKPVQITPKTVAKNRLSKGIFLIRLEILVFEKCKFKTKTGREKSVAKNEVKVAISRGELSWIFFTKFADRP